MQVVCSACGAKIKAPDDRAGTDATCPRCGGKVHLDKAPAVTAAATSVGNVAGDGHWTAPPPPLPTRIQVDDDSEEDQEARADSIGSLRPSRPPRSGSVWTIVATALAAMQTTLLVVIAVELFWLANAPPAVTWEYRIESIDDIMFESEMDKLGAEGWELTFARRAIDSITDRGIYECIFRRPR
jgi:DNA-directed RNA polymerase subunit RPC12/RpoP